MEKLFTPKFKQLNYIYIYFFLLKRDEASVVYTLNKPTNTRFCFIMVSLASKNPLLETKGIHKDSLVSACPTCSPNTRHSVRRVVFQQKSHTIAIFPHYTSLPVTKTRIQHCTQEQECFWRMMAECQHFSRKFLHLEAF